jgi:tripartite-type tricarboxylate transporter receptor subunit TctC
MICIRRRKGTMLKSAIAATSLALALLAAPAAQAQSSTYPNRTVRIIVPYAAGGGTDIVARLVAQRLQESLGQTVIVENRPGASGMLGPDVAAKSTPDGYTLLFAATGNMAVSPAVYSKMPYAPLKDFVPISQMVQYPLIMFVSEKHPATTLKDFIGWAKANPDKTNYASASAVFTLSTELFKQRTGTPGQMIPFKSSNESVTNVVGNQVTFAMTEPPPIVPQVAAGKARALAVAAPTRLPELPDVPTMQQAGVDLNVHLWLGLFAPAGTPPEIVAKLEAECLRMARLPELKERLRTMSTDLVGSTSADFFRMIDGEIKVWTDVARKANIKLEQ